MVEVPGVGGQAPCDRVHDGVLDDVDTTGHVGGEEPLRPARQPMSLGEETSGEEPVVHGHRPVHNVLCENMSADGNTNAKASHFGSQWALFSVSIVMNSYSS